MTPPRPAAFTPKAAFIPKIVSVLREGYGLQALRADALAGLTVAVVALPLSMAIAIASGLTPGQGLVSSVVGGFLVSLLGGSRHQIGGPAGAFIVLVAGCVAQFGVDGMLLATMMSGVVLLLIGALRLGTFIRYIPYPVTVGFTAGIAAIIFASQIKELLGLSLLHEPGPLLPKLAALWRALPTLNPAAAGLSLASVLAILALRRWRPSWPAMLAVVALASAAAWALGLPVQTIGTRFGGIPAGLPAPALPPVSWGLLAALLPTALAFALLGGIESLLSAVVADSMGGGRHRSNMELVAQGVANIAAPLFGGLCVTGAIARTATNVRAGARGPVSGMLHALFLLGFMLVAAPLAAYIPVAALAAVLAVVAWNMAERHTILTLLRASRGDAAVLVVTFLLVVTRDLTEGILAGFCLSALMFLHRMAGSVEVDSVEPDDLDPATASDRDVVVCRIGGAFFFGAAAAVGTVLDRLAERPRAYVLDLSAVAVLDSTAAAMLDGFVRQARGRGAAVLIAGARPGIARVLQAHGISAPAVEFSPTAAEAVAAGRALA
ncbi:MAG TPA: SulP family inorganic anion transporter [Acetobacteraceae bacterium]